MKKLLITLGVAVLAVGAWALTKEEVFPPASDPGDVFTNISSSNFQFQNTLLTNETLIGELFPDDAPKATAQGNLGTNWFSNSNIDYANSHNGFFVVTGPSTYNATESTYKTNISKFQKGLSLFDFGDEIGKVLVLNGINSNFKNYLKDNFNDKFDLSNLDEIKSLEDEYNAITHLCVIPKQIEIIKNGILRVRVELNVFNPSNERVIASILRINANNVQTPSATNALLTEVNSKSFRQYTNDSSNEDLGSVIANTWNPYRWMVYEYDIDLSKEVENNRYSYLRIQLPANVINTSAILIRNIEMFHAEVDAEKFPDLIDIHTQEQRTVNGNTDNYDVTIPRISWLDFTPEVSEPEVNSRAKLYPKASRPGSEYINVSSSNFQFKTTELTNENVVSTLFPSGAPEPLIKQNIGNSWLSTNKDFIDKQQGFLVLTGPYCYEKEVLSENVENFKKGFSIIDLGNKIGKALVINGYNSNFSDYLKESFKDDSNLTAPSSVPKMSDEVSDITQLCFIPNQAWTQNGGKVRMRVELNAYSPDDKRLLASILRLNNNTSGQTPLSNIPDQTEVRSSSFRQYTNDNSGQDDLGDIIEESWNPYRWMVYEADFNLELETNAYSYVKFQIPSDINGSTILIRNVEFYQAKGNLSSNSEIPKYTWLDFTSNDIDDDDLATVPMTKEKVFPKAEAIPSNFKDVTPSYYKFYLQNNSEFLNEMLRDDILSPAPANLGNESVISKNTNNGENWFTNASLAKGNLIYKSGGYRSDVTPSPLLKGISTFNFGDEIGSVLVLNGKNSQLNEKIQPLTPNEHAYNIPKLENSFQNLQLMWILDHVSMKSQKINADSLLHIRMEVNVYNNDMLATETSVFTALELRNEQSNGNEQKIESVTVDQFSYRNGDNEESNEYDATPTGEWNPYRWMVLDFETTYSGIASFLRTAILNDDVHPYDNGALLIRSIEIYGVPKLEAKLTKNKIYKSWNEYSIIKVREPNFDEYKETPSEKSIEKTLPAGDVIEDENFSGFQNDASLTNIWSSEKANVTKNYYYSATQGKNSTLDEDAVILNGNSVTISAPEDLGEELNYGVVRINTGIEVKKGNTYNFSCQSAIKTRAIEDAPNILVNVTSDGQGAATGLANKTSNGITHYVSNVELVPGNLVLEVHFGGNAGKVITLSDITFTLNSENEENSGSGGEGSETPDDDDDDFEPGESVNNALKFADGGFVNCGAMPELNNQDSYSLQFWFKTSKWNEGSSLMHRGDSFSVELGKENSLVFKNGDRLITATGFNEGEWNHVTLIVDLTEATVLVNGNQSATGILGSLEDTKRPFVLGGNYSGYLDEVRVWDASLNDTKGLMKRFDYFAFNTLNKWNPMWENLVAYYKMDQNLEDPIVLEYKTLEDKKADGTGNHGVMTDEGVEYVLADNDKMPYLVSAAYTENERFYDRLIPRDAYLLSNEIIILGADCVAADGSVKVRTPNNHGVQYGGVSYVASKGNRSGVAYFDGKATSYIEAPAESIHSFRETSDSDLSNTNLNTYTLLTRLYIDEWQPGAYIFRKENDAKTAGIAIYLGETEKTLTIRVDGKTNTSKVLDNFKLGQWNHFTIYTNKSPRSAATMYYLYVNGNNYTFNSSECAVAGTSLTNAADCPVRLGEGLKGWMDETYLCNDVLGSSIIQTYTNKGVIIPTVNQGRNVKEMKATGFLFNYDDAGHLGYSSFSQDYLADYIRSLYKGYTPAKVVLSVRGHSDNTTEDAFRIIMNDPAKTKKFAKDLIRHAEKYDGVEFDLEWCEGETQWSNYSKLSDAVEALLPEDKTFRISIHNSYYHFPKDKIGHDKITGFTVQQYGPNSTWYPYSKFLEAANTLENYGYPKEKTMTSFSTTMEGGGDIRGGAFDNYQLNDGDVDKYNGMSFMGPMQIFNRAKYTRENGYQGIFYWAMGNDIWLGTKDIGTGGVANYEGMPEYNAAKYGSYGLNANIDRAVRSVAVNQPETENAEFEEVEIPETKDDFEDPEVDDPNNGGTTGVDNIDSLPQQVDVYSITGALVRKNLNKSELNTLPKGLYIINSKKVMVK